MTGTIAGIAIPDSALAREATELVRETASQMLFDHSRRGFLWASLQAERSAHERFEIDGANAARAFLESHGLPEPQIMTVWQSIALHTTRQIPDYLQPEVRLEALADGARDKPETAIGTMLTDILEATVPGYVRPNVCELIESSPFET